MKKEWKLGIAIAVTVALMVVPLVLADVLHAVVATGADTITAGDSTTIGYYVTKTGGTCDPANGAAAVVTINAPSNVTVSPNPITLDECRNDPELFVVFSSNVPGNYSVTASVNDADNPSDTYTTGPAAFTLHVTAAPVTNTAPQVSVVGPEDGASYEFGSVPAATCSVVDTEDTGESATPVVSDITGPLELYGLGSQTVTCSYVDGGGLSASASATYSIVDTVAPTITFVSRTPDANSHGWNNSDVTVTWSCTDNGSGAVAATVEAIVSGEGTNQSTTGTCTDSAGNSASNVVGNINIDKTNPTITGSRLPLANSFGWNNTSVTVTFSCGDDLSGVASCGPNQTLNGEGVGQSATGTVFDKAGNSASTTVNSISIDKTAPTASASASPVANANGWNNSDVIVSFSGTDALSGIDTCSAPVILSAEGINLSATGACKDKAGNLSPTATAAGIKIDKTNPIVALVGGPADGGSYYFGFVPAAPTCSAEDGLSGLDGSCDLSGYGTNVGTHTVTASATDKAGNSASASTTYTVLAWKLYGFYQPVDMGSNVVNTVKGGSTVPLKFEVFAGSTELTNTSAVTSFKQQVIGCANLTGVPTDEIEMTTTGSTSLRYDTTAGQFIQNWQTPKASGMCYKVTMTTLDGSYLEAYFKLK